MSEFRSETFSKADLLRVSAEMRMTRTGIETADGRRNGVHVRPVTASIGHLYQAKLHYLLSPRADMVQEWGLFEDDCDYPLLYFGFTSTDHRVLSNLSYSGDAPLTLARAVSIVDLPKNAFSYTVAQISNRIQHLNSEFSGFVTAVNPYLGFTAASVLAAGFRPVATRPVAYWYDEHGSFTTRRFRSEGASRSCRRMPPNIQFFRGADTAEKQLFGKDLFRDLPDTKSSAPIFRYCPNEFRAIVEEVASGERQRVAHHWSNRTRHPDFIGRLPIGGSAGQCGVTSVHVARVLTQRLPGASISYCYGDLVSSTDSITGIHRHCWLRVTSLGIDLVVDCTPDQPGGIPERQVLVMTDEELLQLGLSYIARTVRTVDALVSDRVWPRYLTLADSLMGEA